MIDVQPSWFVFVFRCSTLFTGSAYTVPGTDYKIEANDKETTGHRHCRCKLICSVRAESTLLEATNLDFQKISIRTMLTEPILGVSLNSPVQDSRRCCCCVKPCACAPPQQEAASYYKYIRVPGTTLSAIPAPAIVLPFGYF